jgi:hypothetical protein
VARRKKMLCFDTTSVDYRVQEVSDEENHSITTHKVQKDV